MTVLALDIRRQMECVNDYLFRDAVTLSLHFHGLLSHLDYTVFPLQ